MCKKRRNNKYSDPIGGNTYLGRITLMIKSFEESTKNTPKRILHPYCDKTKEKLLLLLSHAIHELLGHDYRKRIFEALWELEVYMYVIQNLGGFENEFVFINLATDLQYLRNRIQDSLPLSNDKVQNVKPDNPDE